MTKKEQVILVFSLLYLIFLVGCSNNDNKNVNVKEENFLIINGNYSMTSSTWGIGIEIDSKAELPKQYVIEWTISNGTAGSWDESTLQPLAIETNQNGKPFTLSDDANNGAIIWSPDNFENTNDVSIEAYIYEDEKFSKPIAYSKITLENDNGTYNLKTDETK